MADTGRAQCLTEEAAQISSSTEDQISANTKLHQDNASGTESPPKYGVGITGFDRITNPYLSRGIKTFWTICFLLFLTAAVYQVKDCVMEFLSGKPDFTVQMNARESFSIPSLMYCGNIVIGRKSKKFKESKTSILEFWKLQTLNLTLDLQCTTTKNDHSCLEPHQNLNAEIVDTTVGRCLKTPQIKNMKVPGPVSAVKIDIKRFVPDIWKKLIQQGVANFYATEDESGSYVDEKNHMIWWTEYMSLILEVIEVNRMNLSHSPCETTDFVKRCVNKCLEDLIYSEVTCRFPLMTNKSMPFCQSVEDFILNSKIIKNVTNQKQKCRNNCPNLCHETMNIIGFDYVNPFNKNLKFTYRIFDKTVLTIHEVQWYSFSSLIADIGGILGFFLDIVVLTIPELIEFSISFSQNDTSDPIHLTRGQTSSHDYLTATSQTVESQTASGNFCTMPIDSEQASVVY